MMLRKTKKALVSDLTNKSNIGDSDAQFELGVLYFDGQDYGNAIKWFEKSAKNGNDKAQYNLGWCYANGNGVEKDLRKAFEYFEKSAVKGNADAQFELGVLYFDGQDYGNAIKWFEKSAKNGNDKAQYNLGLCYANGNGVEKDLRKAFEYFEKSAEKEYAVAQNHLGYCYYNGEGAEKDLKKAVEYFEKSADQGNAVAQYILGYCYLNEQNYDEAVKWFKESADKGYVEARKILKNLRENADIPKLKVSFLDVGQGDCILVQQNGENMLIDAGGGNTKYNLVSYLKNQGITNFKYILGTHPHDDHIGGMSLILDEFAVNKMLLPFVTHTSVSFQNLIKKFTKEI